MYDISVVIPVYNQKEFIRKALKSVVNQKYDLSLCQLIIADDCSPDQTYAELPGLAEELGLESRFGDVKIFQHEQNKGLMGNLDSLFKLAQGKVVIPFAGDDWLDENCFYVANKLLKNVDVGMGFSNGLYEYPDGSSKSMYPETWQAGKWDSSTSPRPDAVRFYTKTLYEKAGLPLRLRAEGVWLISHALAYDGVFYSPEHTFHYRIHGQSITSKSNANPVDEINIARRVLSDIRLLTSDLKSKGLYNNAARAFINKPKRRLKLQLLMLKDISRIQKMKALYKYRGQLGATEMIKLLLMGMSYKVYAQVKKRYWRG